MSTDPIVNLIVFNDHLRILQAHIFVRDIGDLKFLLDDKKPYQ
ncbi:hypothetical protein L289_1840 [Acinetobacter gerneri DSM 14967 = CIP 107464 = MTCC 9824]|nr:hypothetical protein L289_1840 [Acinetobacter gerneri DSM 14967 = CIP 107464 = MTCC 9824]